MVYSVKSFLQIDENHSSKVIHSFIYYLIIIRPGSKPTNVLSVWYEREVSVECSCENQNDIYRGCCYKLDIP